MSRSIEKPFSDKPPDIGIFCLNEKHRKQVIEAFQIDARYYLIRSSLCGSRFTKIICFTPYFYTPADVDNFSQWVNESLRSCLTPQGQLYMV